MPTDEHFDAAKRVFHSILVLEMSELCDRNSPEDEPDAMVANDKEMAGCIERALERIGCVIVPRGLLSASKPAAIGTLFEVLMQQNIVTSDESYLALKCVGVPPTEKEFVQAVQRTIDAAGHSQCCETAAYCSSVRRCTARDAAAPAQSAEAVATVYVECNECAECGHIGINDSHDTDASCGYSCGWTGPSPVEDKCPGCQREGVMGLACPKCSGRYSILAEAHIAAPQPTQPAKAGEALRDAVESMVSMLENGEWAEHASTFKAPGDALASRLESPITDLHNSIHDASESAVALDERAGEVVTLPIMRAAFRVTESEGDPDPNRQRFHMRFTFRSLEELHAADDEWLAFKQARAASPQALGCDRCDGTGDVHSLDGEWRGRCPCGADNRS
jgi:hypothetical protein